MTGLQEAFYIIGIVYMGISLLIIIGILIGLGVIRKKVVALEHAIQHKLDVVTSLGERAGEVVSTVKRLKNRRGK